MAEEKYFGVKEILLPDNVIAVEYVGHLLSQIGREPDERVLNAIKLFIDKPMVAISTIDGNWPKDTLIDCMFVGDYLRKVKEAKNIADVELIFDNSSVRLDQVIDLISQNHLNKKIPESVTQKLYTFGISDDKTDLYRIIHVNPVLACLAAENNDDHTPIKLYNIQNVHPGMQFNRGKGQGKIEDLY